MSNTWFRFYSEALNDPKVQSLDGDTFKVWVNLLCVTSQCDGHIIFDDISFHLRMRDAEALSYCKKLADKGLLIPTEKGYMPNSWDNRQYKTDTSAERTKRYRERKKNGSGDVTVTSHVTAPDTDTDTEERRELPNGNSRKPARRKSTASKPDDVPDQVWTDYLALREKKKSPVTETVIAGLRREADKAGMSLSDAMDECCARGWAGFKAEWMNNQKGTGHANARNGNGFSAQPSQADRAKAAIIRGLDRYNADPAAADRAGE